MTHRGAAGSRRIVLLALLLGLGVRIVRVARAPLVHPDGPAYLGLAEALRTGHVASAVGGYYSPLYPALLVPLMALGVPGELAGRLVAVAGGLAALPLLYVLARAVAGTPAAVAAVLVAALHPALVKASAQVLPETLAGSLLLGWLIVLLRADGAFGLLRAGLLAGTAYLARPEAVLLVPLGLPAALRRRGAGTLAYLFGACVVIAPVIVAIHAHSGVWQVSPREGALAARVGIADEPTLTGMAVHHPDVLAREMAAGGLRQIWLDAVALGPLLWVPLALGLMALPPAGPGVWCLAVVAAFSLLPISLDPSPRYAVPLLPLLLPWVGGGLVAIGSRLGRTALPAAAVLGAALAVQALWLSHPFDEACNAEVSGLILSRYGPDTAVVAVDGRFAWAARGRPVVPQTTDPAAALALARSRGARLWLTRPRWTKPPWQPPPDVRPIARPCGGSFVLYEIG